MAIKGWTKMDDDSWRHDGNNQGQNKLNIHLKDEDAFKNVGDHIADVGGQHGATYLVTYTVNDSPSEAETGTHVLESFSSVKDARAFASDVRRENPDTLPL